MRFLIDNALSPAVGEALAAAGHDAVHVRSLRMHDASDEEIFDLAGQEGRVVLSADTDFGTLLAARKSASPSVILFRHGSQHRPADQVALLEANLPQLVAALEAGSVVVIQPDRIRIRAMGFPSECSRSGFIGFHAENWRHGRLSGGPARLAGRTRLSGGGGTARLCRTRGR